jgi:hypothetical protein
MGLYNFQPRFVEPILNGTKRHTIRQPRKHPDRVGSTLHLYTGLRRPGARLLARVECTAVCEITISAGGEVEIDRCPLTEVGLEELARRDGFDDWPQMLRFWRLPFEGQIISWAKGGA